jgi:PAS domain-containing protein
LEPVIGLEAPPDEQDEMRASSILDVLPDFVFLIHEDGTYLDYHAGNESESLVSPENFLGKNMREIMPPDVADKIFDVFETAKESDKLQCFEYVLDINGLENLYECRLIRSGKDKFLSAVRNITEQRRAEKALRESEEFNRRVVSGFSAKPSAEIAHTDRTIFLTTSILAAMKIKCLQPVFPAVLSAGERLFTIYVRSDVAGQYIDRNLFSGQLEFRQTLRKRLGFVVFGGIGEVANTFNDFSLNKMLPAAGASLRFRLKKQNRLNRRFDYALGKGKFGIVHRRLRSLLRHHFLLASFSRSNFVIFCAGPLPDSSRSGRLSTSNTVINALKEHRRNQLTKRKASIFSSPFILLLQKILEPVIRLELTT